MNMETLHDRTLRLQRERKAAAKKVQIAKMAAGPDAALALMYEASFEKGLFMEARLNLIKKGKARHQLTDDLVVEEMLAIKEAM
jgi:hypothetical protein